MNPVVNFSFKHVQGQGFDIVASYGLALGRAGTLSFHDIATVFTKWDLQKIDVAPVVDCNGKWGGSCEGPTSEFQNHLGLTWNTPWWFDISAAWWHQGEAKTEAPASNVDIEANNYFDLAANVSLFRSSNARHAVSLRAGITNLPDEEPPVVGSAAGPSNNGNTLPSAYDTLACYLFVSATYKVQ